MAAETPAALGYRMPAEWEPHAATWISWPHDPVTFPGRVEAAEETYRQMIRALAPHERVNLLVRNAETHDRVADWLLGEHVRNVTLWEIPYADVWFRDYGPAFVKRERPGRPADLAMVKWRFNAWGGKYETLLPDDAIPLVLQPHLGLPVFEPGIVLEGGSIDVNGAGSLITTEQCLLNPNRNPELGRVDVERHLRDQLGVRHVLWLGDGLEGDDTDGHVDDLARFVSPSTVVAVVEDDPRDANHAPLAANLDRLRRMTDQDGRPLAIVEIPTPGRVGDDEGRLPASYANFYVANGVVLLPVFGHRHDARAEAVLAKCFPGRRIVPIRCEDLVYGMGTLHCVTQQQPST